MRTVVLMTCVILTLVPAVARSGEAPEEGIGILTSVEGDVQIGEGGRWRAAASGGSVTEGQIIRTGADSQASVRFGEGVSTTVAPEREVAVTDLLLRARLERMRSRVSAPGDTKKVEMQVTPTTGVRGTEQAEEKAEDLKREHYWNEGEQKAE